jgi:hypothetical protein
MEGASLVNESATVWQLTHNNGYTKCGHPCKKEKYELKYNIGSG